MVLEGQVRTRGMLGGGKRKEEGGEGGNEIREKRGGCCRVGDVTMRMLEIERR